MSVSISNFGLLPCGTEIEKYTIVNKNDMEVSVITYGAALTNIFVKDRFGKRADVLVGFDDLEGFVRRSDYQGVVVGPYANRIGGACFSIDGNSYKLTANEKGVTCLHSAGEFNTAVWKATITDDHSVGFSYTSPDGLNGFPGNTDVKVTYILTDNDELKIEYSAVSDRKTVINLTNHAYFNLSGFSSGTILDHMVTINADYFTPVDEYSIPTGTLQSVESTPFDLRQGKRVGEEIEFDCRQLKLTGGYDHNFVINGYDGSLRKAAEVYDDASGRKMEVFTDLPGIQFYSGNFLKGDLGKDNKPIVRRAGLCLETQFFPDTPNKPDFPQCTYDKGEEYSSETIFKFSAVSGS